MHLKTVGLISYSLDRSITGIGRYAAELARALVTLQSGPSVTLLTAGWPSALAEIRLPQATLPGCRLLPGLVTLGNLLIPLRAHHLGLDLVHDPTGVTPFLFGAGGARTVVTVHDVFAWSYPGTSTILDTLIYRQWLPRVLPRVDAVITDSKASKADIIRYLRIPAHKIRTIYLGVNPAYRLLSPDVVKETKGKLGLPQDYLLFVGSVQKRKNLRGLLQAYAALQRMGETSPLAIVGTGRSHLPEITRILEELALRKHVIMTGYVPEADLPAVYNGASLFVFPSLYEGFGLPVLEAMACGVPVICSNAGSLPEVAGEAALMVDPQDTGALAQAMHRTLTDADLRGELREMGLARARQYTWERTARETVAVYREVIGE